MQNTVLKVTQNGTPPKHAFSTAKSGDESINLSGYLSSELRGKLGRVDRNMDGDKKLVNLRRKVVTLLEWGGSTKPVKIQAGLK